MKSPAFQFYPGDWLSSQRVSLMSLEEEGAYIRLLSYCWQHGSIPSDPQMIARLIGKGASTTLAATLATMFQPFGDGLLLHPRLEQERKKQKEWREKSAEGGRKSAEARKSNRTASYKEKQNEAPFEGCLPNAANQTATLPSASSTLQLSSSSPSYSNKKPSNEKGNDPEKIYQAYPRKVAKPDAIKAIEKALRRVPASYLLERTQEFAAVTADVPRQFIPHPSTWFNQERYDDDPSEWNPEASPTPDSAGEGTLISDVVALYPRRENTMAACQAIAEHLRKDTHLTLDVIAAGTRAIASVISELPGGHLNGFVPGAEKFFRMRRWEDDPATWLRQCSTSGAPVKLNLGGREAGETILIGKHPTSEARRSAEKLFIQSAS